MRKVLLEPLCFKITFSEEKWQGITTEGITIIRKTYFFNGFESQLQLEKNILKDCTHTQYFIF